MKRSGPIKRKPKPKLTAIERRIMGEFLGNTRRQSCRGCGKTAAEVQISAHHVLRRQVIERVLKARGLSAWEVFAAAWDPRWRMPVCPFCHGDHHSGLRRFSLTLIQLAAPKSLLVAKVYDLIDELKAEHQEAFDG